MNARVRLGVLTDLHLAPPGTSPRHFNDAVRLDLSRELLARALEWLRPRADVVALLGDLADDAAAEEYRYLLAQLRAANLPVFVVPGNHDLLMPGSFEQAFTDGVVVPGPSGTAVPPVRIASAPLLAGDGGYRVGGLDAAGPNGGPLVWLTRFPVVSLQRQLVQSGLRYAGDLANREALHHFLADRPGPVIVLAGHLHVRDHIIDGTILQLDHGALAERPHDVAVVTVTAHQHHLDVVRTCHRVVAGAGDPPAARDPLQGGFRWADGHWRPLHTDEIPDDLGDIA